MHVDHCELLLLILLCVIDVRTWLATTDERSNGRVLDATVTHLTNLEEDIKVPVFSRAHCSHYHTLSMKH